MKNKNIILMRLVLISFFLCLTFNTIVTAQKKNTRILFKGIVTDKFKNPIAGAEVRVKNTDKVAATDNNGSFELNVTDALVVIEISKNGYATISVPKADKMNLEVVLQRDATNRYQKILTGYDKKAIYAMTSPVATITGEELVKTPYMNLAAALVGRLPGLISQVTSAEPGAEVYSLYIRGLGSTTGTIPLILIDGVPMDNLQSINPCDVASVSVFKDAASTIFYGMQAAHGIISVVTKEGDYGKPRISISVNTTYMTPTRTPQMINSGDYATLRNQAAINDKISSLPFTSTDIANYYKNFQTGDSAGLYPNTNWYNTFIQPMVQTQRYNLSATGGIDGLKYYTNVGYSRAGSPYITDNGGTPQSIDRVDFRSNVEVKLNNYISAFMKVAGQVQRQTGSNTTAKDIYSSVFNLAPTMYGPLTPAGQVITSPTVTDPLYGRINSAGNLSQTSTNLNSIIGLNIDMGFITKGLSAKVSGMFNGFATSKINGTKSYERWTRNLGRLDSLKFIKQGTQLNTPLVLTKTVTTNYAGYFDGLLRYDKQLGVHTIGALVFARYQYSNHADLDVNGYLPYIRQTSGGQLNYSLSDILFANVAASYEGTEAFAPGLQYGLFPAASMAWVISNFDFLKNNKILTFLKLRASYGINGNDQEGVSRLVYSDNLSRTGTAFVSNLGTPINELLKGNPTFTWEKSEKINLGLDFTLFNQVTLGFDIFRETGTGLVKTQSMYPDIMGVPATNLAPINFGKRKNEGFEIQLGYNKPFSKDFTMSIQTYADFARNSSLKSDVLLETDGLISQGVIGARGGQIYGYVVDKSNGNGYFNSLDEIKNSGLTYSGLQPRVGDFIYKDINGDHIINESDARNPMGYSTLPEINYGANLNLKWKNFDASILVQGVTNVSRMNSGLGYFDYVNQGTYFEKHLTTWTADRYANGLPITGPAVSNTQNSSSASNDYYLSDRSYTRIKNVEIGYQLPSSVAKRIMMESLRIYISGNNLLTFDNMNNKDIDVENTGYTAIPINKAVNVGLIITF